MFMCIFNVQEHESFAALIYYEPNDMMTFTATPSKKLVTFLKVSMEIVSIIL